VVKVICTCNVSWRQTVAMAEAIVNRWGIPTDADGLKAFPTPGQLARVRVETLRKYSRVGYRARYIHALARAVVRGTIDLDAVDQGRLSSEASYALFRAIPGVGDYAASHLCMLVGHYDRLAVDTEMRRLLAPRLPGGRVTAAAVQAHYARWQPYAYLAYWFELWSDYMVTHGRSEYWSPAEMAGRITARRPVRPGRSARGSQAG